MSNGRIDQVGAPNEVYEEPASAKVADFLGVANLMEARGEGGGRVRVGDFQLVTRSDGARGRAMLVVRPERVVVEPHGTTGENRVPAMVERVVYMGPMVQLILRLAPGTQLQAMIPNRGDATSFEQGTPVCVFLPPDAVRVLPADEERMEEEGEEPAEPEMPGVARTKPI